MQTPSSLVPHAFGESESVFEEDPGVLNTPVITRRGKLWNTCVGLIEKRRAYPSDRARKEYLEYYAGLYQDRGPNPERFQELLRRNGRPFMINPFPEGTPEHYLYHPEGLGLADIEAILGSQAQDWKKQKDTTAEPQAETKWPSINDAARSQEERVLENEREWALLGGICWGMTLVHSGSLGWVRERVHPDNLAWATVYALNKSPWQNWPVNRAQVLSSALEHNLFSDMVAKSLFPWSER